jgi:hypothetical protein
VPLVGAVLDLAEDALPVGLVGVVALEQHLEAKALRSVTHLLLPERVDAPVHVLARYEGLQLLEAHEVLLVEGPQPVDGDLEVTDVLLDLLGRHGRRLA